jgi:hypothetical protein
MSETETTTTELKNTEPAPTEEAWRRHVAAAAKFRGSDAEYCRVQGLDAKAFRAQKKKFNRREAKAPAAGGAFVKVEAPTSGRAATLPDPRWTAEFVAALIKNLR